MAEFAEPDAVLDQAERWGNEVLECRTDGHIWRPLRASLNQKYGFFTRVQRCSRCLCVRTREISRTTGRILRTRLNYSDTEGYLVKGLGRITGDARGSLLLLTMQRTMRITQVDGEDPEDVPTSRVVREALGLEETS